jgi:hypothetical protein
MFRSLLYDHSQRSSFALSSLQILRLFASSSCLFGMWLYVVYVCVCVCPMYLSVGCLVVNKKKNLGMMFLQKSYTYTRNISVPKTLLCITPDVSLTSVISWFHTLCVGPTWNFLTQTNTLESTPEYASFESSRSWRNK